MKKYLLLVVGIMSFSILNAGNVKKSTDKIGVNNRYYNNAVTFVERGVKFHVFLNGDFDFNTHPKFKRGKGNGIRIKRNYKGQIRRIGNVFINYDRRGNVTRIGKVFMNYRFGQLTRVGNMIIQYDRWGNPSFRGKVKGNYYNDGCIVDTGYNYGIIYDYDNDFFFRKSFKKNYRQIKEDDNFYYFKAKSNAKVDKRDEFIKRRKVKKTKYKTTKESIR